MTHARSGALNEKRWRARPNQLVTAPDTGLDPALGMVGPMWSTSRTEEAMFGGQRTGRVTSRATDRVRRRFNVIGLVQVGGFRPFAYVTASRLGLTGMVASSRTGAVVEVEGGPEAVEKFGRLLLENIPPLAEVERVDESDLPPQGGTGFTLGRTVEDPGRTLASPDISVCDDCLAELADPQDRRYRHPFISCANCGPRFTIMTALPYERSATTMAGFTMCGACRAEYDDPGSRRFHAQSIACHECGPSLELLGADLHESGDAALRVVCELLADGAIIAVKGLGGYHVACDARNETVTAELRRRRRRGGTPFVVPFAVMAADMAIAAGLVALDDTGRALLSDFRKSIVLLPRLAATGLPESVAPGNPDLGVMLPSTPLHSLLFGEAGPDVLVITSSNHSGEPIVTDDDEALHGLTGVADAWLRHDRPIQVPCDDSVVRIVAGVELPIRRSRGHAPIPLALPFAVEPVLASGADLKNACGVASGRYAWLSQHIGDLDDVATQGALTASARHLEELTGVRPGLVVADYHPGYRSTAWARAHAGRRPVRTVQHHHAHVASVMGEHGLGLDDTVIGVAFDGTGYGLDGAVWGGEVLVAGYRSFRRVGQLTYVPMAGGDLKVQNHYLMALSHLRSAGIAWSDDIPAVAACPIPERDLLAHQLEAGLGCVPTSSMGRLFDAVASLIGVHHQVDHEAEAAIELESRARGFGDAAPYSFFLERRQGRLQADPASVIFSVVADLRREVSVGEIAARFHAGVAALIVQFAEHVRERTGLALVVLSGGVFANSWLLDAAVRRLEAADFTVLRPHLLPPNDGGIALGQILVGSAI